MKKDKTFAWFPLLTEDNELIWLKHLNVEDKHFEHNFEFWWFGEYMNLCIGYNRNVFSKIK